MKLKLNEDWLKTFLSILIFASLFVFLGQAIPKLYIEHFDNTDYIYFDVPMTVDPKEYKSGQRVQILSNSHVKVSREVDIDLQLMRVNQGNVNGFTEPDLVDNVTIVKGVTVEDIIFTETDKNGRIFTSQLPLPKDLEAGNYYIQGVIHYQIKGVAKEYYFYTQQFSVVE